MKKLGLFLSALAFTSFGLTAQTADEVINEYHEVTGGAKNWAKIKGVQMDAKVNQGGMEIPVTVIQMADGSEMISINLQGQEIVQSAYDGESLWSTNFQTMKPEKADEEALINKKKEDGDFPDALLNYKEKGYKAEFVGKETIEGTECYKVKFTKKPQIADGQEVDNIEYYFFDTENNILIAVESEITSGTAKGSIAQVMFSDYQEVDGLYFPFSISQGLKGGGSQPLEITAITVNPDVSERNFSFPEEVTSEE
ncbi:outer membrane lipoprotein-sorting protein [Owenweeksia hongkongensis]|uniref:outer membrane lipoprotein-sorting protein n=1 Tax=Owenweeksia hongkongensis TaxID=253245 RepID=UPI003A93CEE9